MRLQRSRLVWPSGHWSRLELRWPLTRLSFLARGRVNRSRPWSSADGAPGGRTLDPDAESGLWGSGCPQADYNLGYQALTASLIGYFRGRDGGASGLRLLILLIGDSWRNPPHFFLSGLRQTPPLDLRGGPVCVRSPWVLHCLKNKGWNSLVVAQLNNANTPAKRSAPPKGSDND